MKATVFIGAGRITSALVVGLRASGYDRPIIVHDHRSGNLRRLRALIKDRSVTTEPGLARAVSQAGILIVAVRPSSVASLLNELRKLVAATQPAPSKRTKYPGKKPLIAVSLAAGIPLNQLRAQLGSPVRWARAMPSPVCRSASGLTGLSFSRDLTSTERRHVRALFARVGAILELPENQFDAFSVTYSSSHGYHALAALAESAMRLGLDRKAAFTASTHALADGINYWRAGKISLHRLLDEAATPGGVAAATMAAMDKSGHRRAVEQGLRVGLRRTRANAKAPLRTKP